MNRIPKLFLILVTLCILAMSNIVKAQVSVGGTPPSFITGAMLQKSSSDIPVIDLPVAFDVEKLKAEDAENKKYGAPPRLGVGISADNLNFFERGKWITLPDGQRICRLSIRAAGATALNIYYKQFYIPEGGKLYIYNKERTHVIGAYTNNNNLGNKAFATEYTAGDEVVLEYVAPAENPNALVKKKVSSRSALFIQSTKDEQERASTPRIIISQIGYAYSDNVVITPKNTKLLGESGSCMVNINCPEGADWQAEKNAVARMIIFKGGGQFYCSGTLINNTSQDFTPYLISAFHCFEDITTEELQEVIFYFHYEQPGCANLSAEPAGYKTIVGSTIRVNIPIKDNSDGLLVELSERIPEDWNLYWVGWDRRNTPLDSGVCIHHPVGDAMKISTVVSPAMSGSWPEEPYGGTNMHWEVYFAVTQSGFSTVEGGSSGSALFNQDHRLVGTLTGGSSTCQNPTNPNLYGKLWAHWDQSIDPTQQMKTYLDPINSGADTLDGRFLTGNASVNFSASTYTAYAGEEIRYIDLSYGATTWEWEFPGGTPATSTDRNPVVVYATPGMYSAKLRINKDAEDLTREKVDIVTITQKAVHCDAESFTVGTGTSTSAFPLGLSTMQAYSASIYKIKELGERSGTIDKISWNTSAASNTVRKIKVYLKEVSDSTFTAVNTWTNETDGAMLVYESDNNFTSASGWVDIPLTTPFAYSATKHLKVLVYAITASGSPVSSACYYTTVSNTHMQWTAPDATPIAGNGTINDNRPNMKISFAEGDCGRAPKAQFEIVGNPFYTQGFDSYTFPPANWIVEKPGTSASQWIAGNVLTYPFNTYDPNNLFSAAISPDAVPIDTWLISEEMQLTNNATSLQFYIGFNPSKAGSLPLTFYISTDNKATWQEKWTTPALNAPWTWVKMVASIEQYAGQKVYFAWRVHGTGGDFITIDGVKLFEKQSSVNINEGDEVSFTDKSTGPPVYWKWDLPGGSPNKGTATSIQSTYLNEGAYSAKVTVKNNIGADSLIVSNAVNVTARKPVARIKSSGGYTRAINSNNFIPVGGTVSYADTSLYVPKTWAWTFDGGNPSSSADKKVNVRYDTEGEFATGLTITNAKGTDNTLVNNYVKVGGSDRIWNMQGDDKGEQAFIYGEEGDGYLTGTCITKADKFAEMFVAPQVTIKISAIDVRFMIDGEKVDGEKVSVAIYSATPGLKPIPKDKLVSVDLPISQINPDGYTSITLPEPLITSSRFYVVVEGFSKLATQLVIASSELSFYGRSTAYIFHLATWYRVPDYVSEGVGLSLNIVPTVTYLDLRVAPTSNYTIPFDDTASRTVNVESNTTWTAQTTQSWISLSSKGATGNSSFTFKCEPNDENIDRYGVIVLDGGVGLSKRIYITQTTGDSIVGLKAELMKQDYISVDVRWGQSAIDDTGNAKKSGVVLPNIQSAGFIPSGDLPKLERIDISETPQQFETYSAPKTLSWGTGVFAQKFTYYNAKQYRVATLFYPEDLLQYHGGELSAIDFYPASKASFRLMVYQNEVLVLNVPLQNIVPNTYNRIDISNYGVIVDATKSLRITLEIVAPPQSAAITYDASPTVRGKGDLLDSNLDGVWVPFSDFADQGLGGNWLIRSYVKMQDTPESYYRLYRDGKMIAETDKTNYIDQRVMIAGEHCYEVARVSNSTGIESPKSNKGCVTIKPVLVATVSNVSTPYGHVPSSVELGELNGIWNRMAVPVKITKQPTISVRSDITTTSRVGYYPDAVKISDLEVENNDFYNIIYYNGILQIARREVAISSNEDTRKTYGDSDPTPISYSAANIANGEQLVGNLSRVAGEGVGTYLLNKGTLNEANNPNYAINLSPSAVFTITARPVTVIPNPASKVYGDTDPLTLPFVVQNILLGESLTGHLMREGGENVGEYNIMQGQVDNVRNPNYDITFKTGRKFEITPREISVTPESVFKTYGEADPAMSYKVVGLMNNESLQGALTRLQGEDAGKYDISLGTLSAGDNYKIKFIPGVFTINPANLFVQADNLNIPTGSILPAPTYTMKGYKEQDEPMLRSIIDNSIYIDAPAQPIAGSYNILFGSSFSHKNYDATFAAGKLTVGSSVTAFIPGSPDSKNATFMPDGAVYLKVYTRNGVLVYEGSNAWDGNNKQGRVEAGIYFYVASMANGAVIKGSVEVYKF